jgi:hypothetical protein
VDGQDRWRVAAFDTATGALNNSFRPALGGSTGLSIAATNTAVYVGGDFKSVQGGVTPRLYLAAFDASNGTVLPFRADANNVVTALAVTKDGGRLAVGGRFSQLSGKATPGLGSVDPTTGASQSFTTNNYVKITSGGSATITDLTVDNDSIYGSVYMQGGATSEGVFRANAATGDMVWHADCHGDTYSMFPLDGAVYAASHAHWCQSIGGFADTTNSRPDYYRATAYSKAATGKVRASQAGYTNNTGQPAPSLLNWYPQINIGTYTGLVQGPWSVTGNSQYLSYGGEFTQVNGKNQEGLVRFGVPGVAPNRVGPQLVGTAWGTPSVSRVGNVATVSVRRNFDYDNSTLTYRLYREGTVAAVAETSVTADWWQTGTVSLKDPASPVGAKYRVAAVDPFGNIVDTAGLRANEGGGVTPPDPGDGGEGPGDLKPGDTAGSDGFNRTVSGGWGQAATGGGWAVDSRPSVYSVDGSRGVVLFDRAGWTQMARLSDVSQANVDVVASIGVAQRRAVGTMRLWVSARQSADFRSMYLARANVLPGGQVESVELMKRVNGVDTVLATLSNPGITLAANEQVRVRLSVSGSTVQAKAWKVGAAEPGAWQLVVTDSSVPGAGSVGIGGYSGASASPLPVTVTFSDFTAKVG